MPRLFTFGCSFTQYAWPTWADIVAYDRKIEYYNYAIAGMGNVGIFHRIMEADLKHNFQDDDEIYILWSSWSREDRVKLGNWLTAGSVLCANNGHYDGRFTKLYWDFGNDIVKNSTAIISANKMYKHLIKWQATAFDYFTVEDFDINPKLTYHNRSISNLYRSKLPDIPLVYCEMEKPFNGVEDSHPDIGGHFNIANIVYKDLNLQFNDYTVSRFMQLQKDIEKLAETIKKFDLLVKKIDVLLELNYKDIQQCMNYHPLVEH